MSNDYDYQIKGELIDNFEWKRRCEEYLENNEEFVIIRREEYNGTEFKELVVTEITTGPIEEDEREGHIGTQAMVTHAMTSGDRQFKSMKAFVAGDDPEDLIHAKYDMGNNVYFFYLHMTTDGLVPAPEVSA